MIIHRKSLNGLRPSAWAEDLMYNDLLKPNMTPEEIFEILSNQDSDVAYHINSEAGIEFCDMLLYYLEKDYKLKIKFF